MSTNNFSVIFFKFFNSSFGLFAIMQHDTICKKRKSITTGKKVKNKVDFNETNDIIANIERMFVNIYIGGAYEHMER